MSRTPDIRVVSPESFASAGADMIAGEIAERLQKQPRVRVALAGGGTPAPIHRALAAAPHREQVDWKAVDIFFGDERCVEPSHEKSNYRAAVDTLLSHVPIPEANVHRIQGERPPAEAASLYAETIGSEPLDIVILGMGGDGHTASLFPGDSDLSAAPVMATKSPVPPVDRVSLGLPLINSAQFVILLVAGDSKADRLAEVREQMRSGHPILPIARVLPSRLIWLLDEPAASRLPEDERAP